MIELKNFSKKYNKDFNVISNLSFVVENDKSLCVFGKSGCGKTSLLNCIAGLDNCYDGEIFIDGKNRKNISNSDIVISYVMQNPVFFENKAVEENLKYVFKVLKPDVSKKEIEAEIDRALFLFDALKLKRIKIKSLTKIQKFVINMVRVILKKSQILLVDDVFTGLSAQEKMVANLALNTAVTNLSCETIIVCKVPKNSLNKTSNFLFLNFGKNIVSNRLDLFVRRPYNFFAYLSAKNEIAEESDIAKIKNECNKYFAKIEDGKLLILDNNKEKVLQEILLKENPNFDFLSNNIFLCFSYDNFYFDFETEICLL